MSETLTTETFPHHDGDVDADALKQHIEERPELYSGALGEAARRIVQQGVIDGSAETLGQVQDDEQIISEEVEIDESLLEGIRREDISRLISLQTYLRRQVDKDYTHRDYTIEDVDRYTKMTPQELKAMRESSPYSYRAYKEFLSDLRNIRRGQVEYVRQRMSEVPDSASEIDRRKALVEALSFSPMMAARALEQVKKHDSFYSSSSLLTPEEIESASSDKDTFESTLSELLITQPDIVLSQSHLLRELVDRRLLKDALYKTLQVSPSSIEQEMHLNHALNNIFDSREESKLFLSTAINTVYGLKINVINNKNLRNYFEPAEIIELIEEAVKAGHSGIMNENLYAEGLITEEQLLRLLDNNDERFTFHGANLNKCIYAAEEQRYGEISKLPDTVKQKAREKLMEYLSSENREIHDFMRIIESGVYTEDEAKELVTKEYSERPLETLTYLLSLGKAGKYFDTQQLPDMLRGYLDAQDPDEYGYPEVLMSIAGMGLINKEELSVYVERLSGWSLIKVGEKIESLGLLQETELREKILNEYFMMPIEIRHLWLPNAAYFLSEEEFKEEVNKIYAAGYTLRNYMLSNENIKNKIGDSDVVALETELLDKIVSGDISGVNIKDLLESIESNQGISVAKSSAARLGSLPLEILIPAVEDLDRLFDPEFITSLASSLMQDEYGKTTIISRIASRNSVWARYMPQEEIRNLIINAPSQALHYVVLNKQSFIGLISEGEIDQLLSRYIEDDPAEALLSINWMNRDGLDVDEIRISESASLSRGVPIADRYLQSTVARAMSMTKEGSKNILLKEASIIYKSLSLLKKSGLIDRTNQIIEEERLTNSDSLNLIESVAVLINLSGEAAASDIQTSIDVTRKLANALYSLAGVAEVQEIENSRLLGGKEEIKILATYITKHKNSKEHVDLTKSMIDSILSGNYQAWKFGDGSEESFNEMKSAGLYPEGLTRQQYDLWRLDDTSQVREAFAVEADVAARTLAEIIKDNETFFDGAVSDSRPAKEEISEIGRQIAEVEKQKQLLSSVEDSELKTAQSRELQEKAMELRSELSRLQLVDDLKCILSLDAEQIQSGALLNSDGSKGRAIDSVVQRLRKNAPAAAGDVLDQVEMALESFRTQTGEMLDLSITDDSSFLTTMRVGVEPVGSCQNYRTGEFNEALYGYTDANTKILMLRNEKGTPIGRAIFRILADQDGNPSLHVDTIYSTNISDGARRAIYDHAYKKASAMGVALYVSELSQNEEGVRQGVRAVEGIQLDPVRGVTLISKASRAPFVYVDAAGGKMPNGNYLLRGLKKLNITQPS